MSLGLYTERAAKVLQEAARIAEEDRSPTVGVEHIMVALIRDTQRDATSPIARWLRHRERQRRESWLKGKKR